MWHISVKSENYKIGHCANHPRKCNFAPEQLHYSSRKTVRIIANILSYYTDETISGRKPFRIEKQRKEKDNIWLRVLAPADHYKLTQKIRNEIEHPALRNNNFSGWIIPKTFLREDYWPTALEFLFLKEITENSFTQYALFGSEQERRLFIKNFDQVDYYEWLNANFKPNYKIEAHDSEQVPLFIEELDAGIRLFEESVIEPYLRLETL